MIWFLIKRYFLNHPVTMEVRNCSSYKREDAGREAKMLRCRVVLPCGVTADILCLFHGTGAKVRSRGNFSFQSEAHYASERGERTCWEILLVFQILEKQIRLYRSNNLFCISVCKAQTCLHEFEDLELVPSFP